MNKKYSKGRGRGVLALSSFEPCPLPLEFKNLGINNDGTFKRNIKPVNVVKPMLLQQTKEDKEDLQKIIAKYNYNANAAQPGGFKELTMKQGEFLYLIKKGHLESKNPLWWEITNENDEVGFVPASYCKVLEEKPSALPWLENNKIDEEEKRQKEGAQNKTNSTKRSDEKIIVKPYLSAYDKTIPKGANAAQAARSYYCDLCGKNLNGPLPYKMHMSSKAHREEEEAQAAYGNVT